MYDIQDWEQNRNNIRIGLHTFIIHLQFTRLHGGEDGVLEVGEDLGPLGVELGRAERGEQPGAGGRHHLPGRGDMFREITAGGTGV